MPPSPPGSPKADFVPFEGEPSYDALYKVCVIGESGVGKSSMLSRFTDNSFDLDTKATIGVDFRSTLVTLDDGNVCKCQLWDTAGQERFRSLSTSFFRGAVGAILVYDVSFSDSFFKCMYWLDELKTHVPDAKVMLVGNKIDLVELRAVETNLALSWAHEQGLMFTECSAKDSSNVSYAFFRLLNAIKPAVTLARGGSTGESTAQDYKHVKGETIKLSRRLTKTERKVRGEFNKMGCC
jgi:small GTP-binding protein